jgi:hypothetical protein
LTPSSFYSPSCIVHALSCYRPCSNLRHYSFCSLTAGNLKCS